ncbi:MAG: nuclear transport factor 2 family protein [Anaerolineales bacterium]|nr:nuclear transport factor 2 family protein [Anaerolineales bacterium]
MTTRFRTMTLLLIVVLALAACQAPAAAPAEPAAAPNAEAVVQALADALNAGDVDAAMALMSDNPSFTTDETITGVDAVRGLYEELVAGDFRIQPNVQSVEGDTIKSKTLTWGAGMPPAVEPLEADEVYIVQDGKISSISWTPTEESAKKLAAFMTGMEAEATVQALADALNAGDVDAAVALIADNAIFDMADGEPLNGADQFRELFDYLVAGHFRIEATPKNTDGGTVTTDTKTWGDGIPGGGPNIATEVYVVEGGKITSITWTPTEETMANMEAAAEQPATPEPVKVAVNGVEDIVGVWEGGDMGALQFNADGTFLVAESLAGLPDQANRGKYWFEGSQLVFADEDGSGGGSYAVELWTTEEGNPVSLKLRTVKEPYTERGEVLARAWYWSEAQAADETQVTGPMFTITFDGSKCAYDGPDELPAGQPIIMRIDVENQTKFERYGASVITLEEGKGLSDLKALPATAEPPYVQMYGGMSDILAGSSRQSTIEVLDGPVFIECLTQPPWKRVDALGPIAVAKAEPEQPAFTITFDGDQCAYDGPDTLPSGQRITTVLDVTDQNAYRSYGFAVVTLYGDKTMADLEAWPSTDQPPWTKLYSLTDDIPQGTRFEEDAWLVDGPVYLVCFTATDQDVFKSDVVGPIEVAAATAE